METSAAEECRSRFGQIAVAEGFLSPTEVEDALFEQREWRDSQGLLFYLGQILLRHHRMTAPQVIRILRKQLEFSADGSPLLAQDRGRAIGKYRLLRKVAGGAMAVVYEAIDPVLRRRVAIKILRRTEVDSESLARFRREAILAGRLRHPGIVGIHEIGTTTDGEETVHYIAMDFIDGEPLNAVLERDPIERGLRILEQVAAAVGFAHAQGVIHRDLKPENILVGPDGKPVVTDFGLACESEAASRLTMPGKMIGTPLYMAPEQINGERSTPRTDVWALGVILYEALTGSVPFPGKTISCVSLKILHQEPLPPRSFHRQISSDLEAICRKALEKDPQRRYADAAELAEELRCYRNREEIRGRCA